MVRLTQEIVLQVSLYNNKETQKLVLFLSFSQCGKALKKLLFPQTIFNKEYFYRSIVETKTSSYFLGAFLVYSYF